jgi:hypothetical protein
MGSGVLKLVLYSTDHCTLCDQALELLFSMPELAGLAVQVVDVATDDALLDRYGERLPVLEVRADGAGDDSRLLDWPFEASGIIAALNQLHRN